MGTSATIDPQKINRHFVIRWRYADDPSTKGTLISATEFANRFGKRYEEKFFDKAWNGKKFRYEFKIRGKYAIVFNSK